MHDIKCQLANIANAIRDLGNNSFTDFLLPVLAGIITTVIGIIVGFIISTAQEKRKFKRDCHIEYLKLTNNYLCDINTIMMAILNIEKFGFSVYGDTEYKKFSYLRYNDYLIIRTKIREFRKYADSHRVKNTGVYTSRYHQYEEIIKLSNLVLEPYLFIDSTHVYERDAGNYYYNLQENIQKEYDKIISSVTEATTNNFDGFNIENFKKNLISHIMNIKKVITGKK
jgi:hypothetical protein